MSVSFGSQIIKNYLKRRPFQLHFNRTLTQSDVLQSKFVFDKTFYEEHGYFIIRKLVPKHILDRCRQHFLDICNNKVNKGFSIITKERSLISKGLTGEQLVNKMSRTLNDDVFQLYTESKELLDVVEQIIGPDIVAVEGMFLNKPPGTTQHPPHQDLYYFPFRPEHLIVGVWTAIDKTYKENGCLYVIPGEYKTMHPHGYPPYEKEPNLAYHGVLNEDEVAPPSQRVYLHMDEGDTVFFHPLLTHGSGMNQTKSYRKSLSSHYASSRCHYMNVMDTQEEMAREMQNIAIKQGYPVTSYQEVFQLQNKLVRGKALTFT